MSNSVEIQLKSPDIPSKFDIIPIHTSDIANYKRCRRYWDWSSPTRTNLRHKVEIYGINFNLWFGTGIHYALECFYDPILRRDPVEAFLTWYQYQWEGGTVGEEWLDRTYDIHPRLVEGVEGVHTENGMKFGVVDGKWEIKGLRELLPDPIEEEFEFHKDLGIGMMQFYKDFAERRDEFEVVGVESVYSIPLGFEVIDRREDSPNYGKSLEVHARGKRDAVAWFPEIEKFGVNEYKTAAVIGEDYFEKYDKDPQATNYLWATKVEALLYDLPWNGQTVDRVVVNALRKNYPKPPTINKNGMPSINRQQEGTNAKLFEACILEQPVRRMWFQDDEKAQKYYQYLIDQGDDLFIQREIVTRNEYEIEAAGEHIRMIAQEMLDPDLNIYPNPTGAMSCLKCVFRPPCLAADDGSDWQGMLEDGYEQNRDR